LLSPPLLLLLLLLLLLCCSAASATVLTSYTCRDSKHHSPRRMPGTDTITNNICHLGRWQHACQIGQTQGTIRAD
jgi:hypothetical protein